MRRIAIINQKGGVGKTTTAANLGAALARAGKRVVVVDMDPQANLSMYLGHELARGEASTYGVLAAGTTIAQAIRTTTTPGLRLVPSHIDLAAAEVEIAGAFGREMLFRNALEDWEQDDDADYLLIDCPPSLGLLSVGAMTAAREVMLVVQTEYFALQGLENLVKVVHMLRRQLNPELEITGILPCLYDARLKIARFVLAELRRVFPGRVYESSIRSNVKLAESPSFSKTIFEYAPDSTGARDYAALAREVLAQEDGAPVAAPPPAPDPVGDELAEAARALEKAATRRPAPDDDAPAAESVPRTPPDELEAEPVASTEAALDESLPVEREAPGTLPAAVEPIAASEPRDTLVVERTTAGAFAEPEHVELASVASVAPSQPEALDTQDAEREAPVAPTETGAPEAERVELSETREDPGPETQADPASAAEPVSTLEAATPEAAPTGEPSSNGVAAAQTETDDGDSEPGVAPRSRVANYGGLLGEERPHLAGRSGPRRPHGDEARPGSRR